MTNAEKFKSAKERSAAFAKFCFTHGCGTHKAGRPTCPLDETPLVDGTNCRFFWLELEYEEPEPELKPCPFCGTEPTFFREDEDGETFYAVKCPCGIRTPFSASPDAPIDTWNRRAK